MANALEVAAGAKSGRQIKGCAIAWGMLCDKAMILEGGRPSKPESTARGMGVINLKREFKRLDEALDERA
jgi:hypothetical protein